MPEDAQAKPSLALTSPLRLALIGAFVPAFPLCIAHGAASGSPTPAVGIVPLFVSFASAAASLRFRGIVEADAERRDDEDAEPQTGAANFREKLTHPIAVFLLDTVLAAALMVVLVFTWVFTGRSASLSMLAAYTTIPLLVGFFVHLYLAVKSFYEGLAIYGLYQWAAWRAVPPDCPSCNVRLRPSLPELPWLKSFQRRRDGYAPVLVNDEDRYRDDIESGAAAAGADTSVPADTAVQPEAVEVRRKDRKSKSSSASEASPWEA